jgi:vancomycin resistance protein YoaR
MSYKHFKKKLSLLISLALLLVFGYTPTIIAQDNQVVNRQTNDAIINLIDNNIFAKLHDEVIPIDTHSFSSQKTYLKYLNTKNTNAEIENTTLCKDDGNVLFTICNITTTLQDSLNVKTETLLEINTAKLESYLNKLRDTTKKQAKNAVLKANAENNIIIVKKEEFGYELDVAKILANINQYFKIISEKTVIDLPLKKTSPTITSANYISLGLKEKIGKGISNFRGSPKNRIHNIHNATSKFEGIIIAPNETFSFVKNLGDVDENTGYKEELVIKDNKTFPEFGGGICQVSTTLFRAAVNTGLEITERRNHAYTVQYYSPQGTDATIYIPKPDLQFKNNTPGYILLQPRFDGTILMFEIYGTSDGRQVKTEGPELLKKYPNGDSKYVWWQIVNDKNGNQISKKGFWSYYQNAAKFHSNHHETKLTSKPKNWSSKEWKKYKRENGM